MLNVFTPRCRAIPAPNTQAPPYSGRQSQHGLRSLDFVYSPSSTPPHLSLPHQDRDPRPFASDQEMGMVFHEHPSINGRLGLDDVLTQAVKKTRPILVILKNS